MNRAALADQVKFDKLLRHSTAKPLRLASALQARCQQNRGAGRSDRRP
jgi:hypothetical protein